MSEYIVEMPKEPAKVVRDGWNVRIEWQYKQREEIVRCRDCEHAEESESGALFCHGYLVESWDWYNDMPSNGVKVEPDDFCAWGERKERIES